MSQILTGKQQEELNKAILQYLEPLLTENSNSRDLVEPLAQALNVSTAVATGDGIIPNYLEKKWSTVLRLQRRILDLESETNSLKSALQSKPNLPTSDDKLKFEWTPSTTAKEFAMQSSQLVSSVQIHPQLPLIFNGCSDGSLLVWSLVSDNSDAGIPEKSIKAHTRGINRIKLSGVPINLSTVDSQFNYILATCSADLTIKIWNSSTYQQVRTLTGHDHTVSSIAFSKIQPTRLYSVSRDKSTKVWDMTNGSCIKSFVGHSDWVRDIDVIALEGEKNTLGDFLLTCSNDQSIRLTHAESGTGIALLIGHSHVIERVKFLPLSSNYILDKYIKENSSAFPTIPQDLVDDPIYTTTLGYKYCISAGRDNTIKLWLLPPPVLRPHRSPLPTLHNNSQGWHIADLIGHLSWVKALEVHPNGKYIFTAGDDKTIKIWDINALLESGSVQCVKTLIGHKGFVNDVNFAPVNNAAQPIEDGQNSGENEDYDTFKEKMGKQIRCIFVSGGVDNSVKVWN